MRAAHWAVVVFGCSLAVPLSAQAPFELSIANVMRGPDLTGTPPSLVRFGDDGRHVYFRWRRPDADTADGFWRVGVAGGEPEQLSASQADSLYPQPGEWSRDRRMKVFALRGDIYLWDAQRGTRRRLTETRAGESAPRISPDGRTVYFVRDNNLWAMPTGDGALRQLTDIRRGQPPARARADSGTSRAFLRAEQERLFEFIRRPPPSPANPFAASGPNDTTVLPRPVYLRENANVGTWDVSPDGRYLLLTVSEPATGTTVQELPVWVTATGYIETPPNRTKVGDVQGVTRAAIVELASGAVHWVDPGLAGRRAGVVGVAWSASSRHVLVRGQAADYEDRWLWVVDVPGFATRAVDVTHDSAWVAQLSQPAGWLGQSDVVWFASEKSGWAHLYTVPAAGGDARQLTSGQFEVRQITAAPDGRRFFAHTNEQHFGDNNLWIIDAGGAGRTQVTRQVGRQDVVVSEDERYLAIMASTANQPPELYIAPNRPGAEWRRITESTTREFRNHAWRIPDLVRVPARDGASVPARLYRPARPNGAAVIFVHGAGYLQNAHRWWSSYSREYMFHHFLVERGYTVLDMDYRGSAGLGRDWRTGIYRHMGGKDLEDHVDGARWLVATQGVDSARVGIYGGSYGGFITLMGMFTTPGVFRAGAALRAVTDWAHYNHGYTAAILNEPQTDSIAYRRSSPIYFAEGLQGDLLIAHGMVDDNVNFQDVVRLAQRLIELGKENWEMAVYPVEPHGFRVTSSWVDEYRRIFRLFETTIGAAAPPAAPAGN